MLKFECDKSDAFAQLFGNEEDNSSSNKEYSECADEYDEIKSIDTQNVNESASSSNESVYTSSEPHSSISSSLSDDTIYTLTTDADDYESSCSNNSYNQSHNNSQCINTSCNETLIAPVKNISYRNVQKSYYPKRGCPLEGIKIDECTSIDGWDEYMDVCGPFPTKLDIWCNNRIRATRVYFRFIRDWTSQQARFDHLADSNFIKRYIRVSLERKGIAEKTRINMLEPLKFTIKWLINCSRTSSCNFIESRFENDLKYTLYLIKTETNKLRPHVKAEEGQASLRSYYDKRNQLLSEHEFNILTTQVSKELGMFISMPKILIATCRTNRNTDDIHPTIFKQIMYYQSILFTSFFLLIPAQRIRMITELRTTDVHVDSDPGFLTITMEKNSFRKTGIHSKVGRTLYLPPLLSRALRRWIHDYIPYFNENTDSDYVFWAAKGAIMHSAAASRIVQKITIRYTKKRITASILRKLKATYSITSIKDGNQTNMDVCMQNYADAGGHSIDVLKKFYLLKDTTSMIEDSKRITELSNNNLFKKGGLLEIINSADNLIPLSGNHQDTGIYLYIIFDLLYLLYCIYYTFYI